MHAPLERGVEPAAHEHQQDQDRGEAGGDDQRPEERAAQRGGTPVGAELSDGVANRLPVHRGQGSPRNPFRRRIPVGDHHQPVRAGEDLRPGLALGDSQSAWVKRRVAGYGRDAIGDAAGALRRGQRGHYSPHTEQRRAIQDDRGVDRLLRLDVDRGCCSKSRWNDSDDQRQRQGRPEVVHGSLGPHGAATLAGRHRAWTLVFGPIPLGHGQAGEWRRP